MRKKQKSIKNKKIKMNKGSDYIKTLIRYTERNIKNDDSELDVLFKNQLNRLKNQLK